MMRLKISETEEFEISEDEVLSLLKIELAARNFLGTPHAATEDGVLVTLLLAEAVERLEKVRAEEGSENHMNKAIAKAIASQESA